MGMFRRKRMNPDLDKLSAVPAPRPGRGLSSVLRAGSIDGEPGGPKRRKRQHSAHRCAHCGLHLPLCLCAHTPRVRMPFRWILVQHGVEVDRPTNTGRMVMSFFPETERVLYGRRGVPLDCAPLTATDTDYLLIFPGKDSTELEAAELSPRPGRRLALVILDGTWRQASHMARRVPGLRGLPARRLPPGPPSGWQIRTPNEPHQLCTLDAAIRTVALAGQAEDARALRIAMEWIMLRMLYMKGRLPRPADRAEAERNVEAFPA